MKIVLCDTQAAVVAAWRMQFEKHPDVEIREGSILGAEADAIAVPGNSFGFLDGGAALAVLEGLGFELQEEVRKVVRGEYHAEMLVGQAAVVPTGAKPPHIIYAPTTRTMWPVPNTLNAYLAARGVFIAVAAFNAAKGGEVIAKIALPGLCTGAGKMNVFMSARQLRYAYEEAIGLRGHGGKKKHLTQLARREKRLRKVPGSVREEEEYEAD